MLQVYCEIWLQIKPHLDVSLTLDAGESKSMLENRRDIINSFVVKLNMQTAKVHCMQLYSENRVILALAV